MTETVEPKPAPKPNPWGVILLLVLALLPYPVMVAAIADSHGTDAAGKGFATAYAFISAFLLWGLLCLAALAALINGRMPKPAAVAAVILVPLSGVAALTAAESYFEQRNGILLTAIALLPPAVAALVLWARMPGLNRSFSQRGASIVLLGLIAVLSLICFALAAREMGDRPARHAKAVAAYEAQKKQWDAEAEERRKQEETRFASLGPDSALTDFRDRLHEVDPQFNETVARVRQVKSRNADALTLLRQGKLQDWTMLWRLDLAATPEFCDAFAGALRGEAFKIDKARSNPIGTSIAMEFQVPNIKWAIANGCDLREPLADLSSRIRTVADSSRLTTFADLLAGLQPGK